MIEAAGSIAIIVVAAFLCWLIVQAGLYLQALPAGRQTRRAVSAPQTADQFNAKVEAQQAKPCPTCGTPFMGKDCSNCGYQVPAALRTARRSWPSEKRRIEGVQ